MLFSYCSRVFLSIACSLASPPPVQNEIATVRHQWPALLNAASLLLSASSTSLQRLYRLTASLYPPADAVATISAAAAASAHASGTDIAALYDGSGILPVQAALTLNMVDSVHRTVAAALAPMGRDECIRHLKQCAPEVGKISATHTHQIFVHDFDIWFSKLCLGCVEKYR